MQKNHAKAIKGLSIASLVISAVLVVVSLIGAIFMGVAAANADQIAAGMGDYNYSYYDRDYDDIYGHHFEYGHGYDDFYDDYYDDYYGGYSDPQFVAVVFGALVFACILAMIMNAATLLGSIIILRNWNKPQNYGKVFGWSIAGAIVGFFGSGIILTVLFVIIAVFSNSDKKLYMSGAYGNAYGAGNVTVPPMPASPVIPVAPANDSGTTGTTGTAGTAGASVPTESAPSVPSVPSAPASSQAAPVSPEIPASLEAPTTDAASESNVASGSDAASDKDSGIS